MDGVLCQNREYLFSCSSSPEVTLCSPLFVSGPGGGVVSGRGPGGGGHLGHAPGQTLGPRGHEGHHPPVHLDTALLSARHLPPRGGEVPVRPHVARHVSHVLGQRHGAGARVLEVFWQTLAGVTSLHVRNKYRIYC